jgi:hypothetical protein
MKLQALPPAHLGPFELEGLEWMTLQKGYTSNDVCGVTPSLAVAKAAHAQLIELGFTYVGPKSYGMMDRLIEFGYIWIDHPDRGPIVYGRRAWVVLTAINASDIPSYEVVDQETHTRNGSVFTALEVPEKRRLFPREQWWTRPTLND